MTSALLFDLDTTLYDESTFYDAAFQKLSQALALHTERDPKVLKDQLWDLAGRISCRHPRLIEQFLNECSLSQEFAAQLLDLLRSHEPALELHDDAKFLLENCPRNTRLGVISDGEGFVERNKVRLLKLANYFDPIILTADFGSGWSKPSTLPLRAACTALELAPSEVIYVGNNPHTDSLAPGRLGMGVVRLRRGAYANHPTDPSLPFHAEITNLSELLQEGFLSELSLSA